MSALAAILVLIANWWTALWRRIFRRGRDIVYRIETVDDEPEQLARGVLYMVVDGGHAWAAVMACPGGCGQALHMNLIPDIQPVWRLTTDAKGRPTLHPSVWRTEGCGCHFFVRDGRVVWCGISHPHDA